MQRSGDVADDLVRRYADTGSSACSPHVQTRSAACESRSLLFWGAWPCAILISSATACTKQCENNGDGRGALHLHRGGFSRRRPRTRSDPMLLSHNRKRNGVRDDLNVRADGAPAKVVARAVGARCSGLLEASARL